MANEIAQTIINQLGGNRFVAMTGAKNFTADKNALSFRIPTRSAKNNINYVKITLTPFDTYMIVFGNIHGTKYKVVSQSNDVYCDMLQNVFTEVTGLYTHL